MPHAYVGEIVELQAQEHQIVVYFRRRQIAVHARRNGPGTTTIAEHMPLRLSQDQQWTPGRLQHWAQQQGPDVLVWGTHQLESRPHPEQAYWVCLWLISLSREYPPERLNQACQLAFQHGLLHRLKSIKAILARHRD